MKKAVFAIFYLFSSIYFINAQTLYGTTYQGGDNLQGTVGQFNTVTNSLTVVATTASIGRHPLGNFIQANDGKLYAISYEGGTVDNGALFSLNPPSFSYITLTNFVLTNGSFPSGSLIKAADGKLYGMAGEGGANGKGVIFSFDPSSSTFTKVFDFAGSNGSSPGGNLFQAGDGKLYGMTSQGGIYNQGVIFSFDPSSSTYTKLIDFDGTNGSTPSSNSLIQATDGKLYGMTYLGGSSHDGVIFSFDPASPAATYLKVKDFDGTNSALNPLGSLMQASDGKLYGMASGGPGGVNGVIFSLDPSSTTFTFLKEFDGTNGGYPNGDLIQASDGKLYGMTPLGGGTGNGIIFSFDPVLAVYTKLKDFNGTDGNSPYGSLVQAVDGKLYGMTSAGGSNSNSLGVYFSFDPGTLNYQWQDLGTNSSGRNFATSLSTATNGTQFGVGREGSTGLSAFTGKLFGMAMDGGSNNAGVIYSFDPATLAYSKLKDLDSANGANPYGKLTYASNGKFYGMTKYGGSSNLGVLFSFDPSSSTYSKLSDYDSVNGSHPYGSLIQASNGTLYGMTTEGGTNNLGVIFSFDPSLSTYTKLKDLDSVGGSSPIGNLLQASDQKLYGVTVAGGSNNSGVIFSFDPASSTYTKLKDFDKIPGETQSGSLIQATDGKLYGLIAEGGALQKGAIFSFDPVSSTYTDVEDFNGTNGNLPKGTLLQASNGKLYGTTYSGGAMNYGVIFSFDPSSSTYAKLMDYLGSNGAQPIAGSAFIELPNSTLPLTLISFTGKNNGITNQLSWQVANETNLKYYELQRSKDGQDFEAISHIAAAGAQQYAYKDSIGADISLVYYYRLKDVDIDGGFTYSNVIRITRNRVGSVTVTPNPFRDDLVLTIEATEENRTTFILSDISGRQLVQYNRVLSPGTNVIRINQAGNLPSGTYMLKIIDARQTQSIKVVKAN
jgi:uncharacterized repeat protein (TIGR03803 family)